MERSDALLQVNDQVFPIVFRAHEADAPPSDAPRGVGAAALGQMGRLTLHVPREYRHLIGALRDFGAEITLIDEAGTVPCHMLMRTVGHPGANAYLFVEPDHYNEWRAARTS